MACRRVAPTGKFAFEEAIDGALAHLSRLYDLGRHRGLSHWPFRGAGLAVGQSAGLSRVLFPVSVDLMGPRSVGYEALQRAHAGAGCRLILPFRSERLFRIDGDAPGVMSSRRNRNVA